MGHTLLCVFVLFLLNTLLYGHAEAANKAVVSLQPNWSEIYVGETITLRCEIEDGGDTEWTYEWTTTSSVRPSNETELRIRSAYTVHSGDYRCLGRMKSEQQSSTGWSDPIRLTVSDRPQPVLTVSPSWLSPGDSVTLNCELQHPSAGWRFYWYKTVPKLSASYSYSSELLPDSSRGTEQDSYIIHGQTHTAGYECRAGRGDPVYYTDYSEPKFVWSADFHSSASLTVSPDRVQHFTKDSVSLNCEGNSAEWRVKRFTENSHQSSCFYWGTITGSTCNINSNRPRDAVYWCESGSGEFSNAVNITVQNKNILLVSPVHPVTEGDSVSLSCKLRRKNFVSEVFFYRNGEIIQNDTRSELNISAVSKSHEGFYMCRHSGQESAQSWMSVQAANKAVVTLQPNWSEIYVGETITLRCEIEDGGDTEWTYEWTTTSSVRPSNETELRISPAYTVHSGDYRCLGRMKSEQQSSTGWSDPIRLTVSDRPQPVLTVSPSWLSPGDSVTLNCELQHPSAGWRFYWYKTVPKLSASYSYSSELLPDSSRGTEQDSYIIHGQTHTAGYECRAGRGDPVYYTYYSEPKFVWSADFHSSASLTVSPDRVQHFTKDSVSLNCEGNSAEWRVRRFTENSYSSSCSDWGTTTGSTCNIYSDWPRDAVYWCESGSGEFSNAVNITVQNKNILLVSPVHPVTEGDSVSLSCKLRRKNFVSKVFFYQNGEIIQNDTRSELNISAVSKSHEGFYKCRHSGQESAQSWMSVQAVSRPEGSSFAVPLIAGLVCGIVLIIILILLCHYRPFKDSCFHRPIQSESTNQGSDTHHVVDQNETQHDQYSTLLHGDVCLYESVKSSEHTEDDDYQDVACSSV